MMPLGVVQQAAGGGVVYDPGMMTYDGSTAYYNITGLTLSDNFDTFILRINGDTWTGGEYRWLFMSATSVGEINRGAVAIGSSDSANTDERNKAVFYAKNTVGIQICRIISDVDVVGDGEKTIVCGYNATAGTAFMYVDGIDADNTSATLRTLTTGTMATASIIVTVGSALSGNNKFDGEIGYFGYDEQYLTNPTDFYHPTNGLQEIDESGWTEWGAQPLFWNQYGTMDDNKGSAGNMTENGTITGPA